MISTTPEVMYMKTLIILSDKLSNSLIETSPMFLDFAGHGWIAWMRIRRSPSSTLGVVGSLLRG